MFGLNAWKKTKVLRLISFSRLQRTNKLLLTKRENCQKYRYSPKITKMSNSGLLRSGYVQTTRRKKYRQKKKNQLKNIVQTAKMASN